MSFLAQFWVFFKNKIKTVICLMRYLALHDWLKFQTNLTTFQGVMSKEPPGSSLQWYFLLVRKHLKYENSGITHHM